MQAHASYASQCWCAVHVRLGEGADVHLLAAAGSSAQLARHQTSTAARSCSPTQRHPVAVVPVRRLLGKQPQLIAFNVICKVVDRAYRHS